MINKVKEQLINKVKEKLINEVKEQLINKVKEKLINKVKEQLINKIKEQLINKVKGQLINKVKEQLIKATNQFLCFLKKPKSLRQRLPIKYVHLSKQKEKLTIIAFVRPKEEIPSVARVMLPDAPFMNP